jgi:type VI secretion system secreted protein Hcp
MNNYFSYTRFFSTVLSAGLLAGSLLSSAANAATEEYLKVGTINGSSVALGHVDWINVDSFSWGVSATAPSSSGGGGGAGKVVFQDFQWTQLIDKSTPPIFLDLAKGTNIPTITFDVVKSGLGEGKPQTFFEMTFNHAFLTNLSLSGSSGSSGGAAPMLDGSFAYQQIKMEYWPTNANGTLGAGISSTYDLRTNKGNLGALVGLYALGVTNPVPEPSTYAMMLAGLGLIGFIAYRRKNDSSDMPMAA